MYANGFAIPEDDAEAVRWYRLAAEQGDVEAQWNLADTYVNGEGVPEDHVLVYNVVESRGGPRISGISGLSSVRARSNAGRGVLERTWAA